MLKLSYLAALVLMINTSAYAAAVGNNPPPPPQDNQRMPPPEQRDRNLPPPNILAEVCKNKKIDDVVTLKSPQGQKMAGSCRLMWVPDGQPPAPNQDRQMPPPPNMR